MKNLWFGQNIKKAVEARRIHHQLFPMSVRYERDFEEVSKNTIHACMYIDKEKSSAK